MTTLKLSAQLSLCSPAIIFAIETEDSLVDTWCSVAIREDPLLGVGYTHDLHIEVGDNSTLKCTAYPLVYRLTAGKGVADMETPIYVSILECTDPSFSKDANSGYHIWLGNTDADPVYGYRDTGQEQWDVFSKQEEGDQKYEDILATTNTETLARHLVGLLQNPGSLERYAYLIKVLIAQIREYSDNEHVIYRERKDSALPDFAKTLLAIETEVGLVSVKRYEVKYMRQVEDSMVVEARSLSDAENVADVNVIRVKEINT